MAAYQSPMFAEAIQHWFGEHRQRLEATYGAEAATRAFERLTEARLGPDDINGSCAKELKAIVQKRYEEPIASSRLQGYGWSTRHVQDHMRLFFKDKMQKAGQVLQASVASQALPASVAEASAVLMDLETTSPDPSASKAVGFASSLADLEGFDE